MRNRAFNYLGHNGNDITGTWEEHVSRYTYSVLFVEGVKCYTTAPHIVLKGR